MATHSSVPFWKTCVSDAVRSCGGEAELQEIYLWFEESDYLGERDKRDWTDGRPMYQNHVRDCISRMVSRGELVRVSRAIYRLP